MKKFIILFLMLVTILMTGCSNVPKTLTIGMVPYNNPTEIINKFEKIKGYLEKEMGVKIEVSVAPDYIGLIEAMKEKKVDIGYYGPFSYVAGEKELNLDPLVVSYRKGAGTSYYSLIITKMDSGIKTIDDLKGKKYAFVDPGSTSGYIIPFAMFKSRDITVEKNFSYIQYAGSHDSVALSVLNGKVDAGSMDDIVLNHMIEAGKLKKNDLNVIWKSEPIPGSPYVARADLSSELKDKFKAAMIAIDKKAPNALLSYDKNVEKFVACDSSFYNDIRNTAEILGQDYIINKFLKK